MFTRLLSTKTDTLYSSQIAILALRVGGALLILTHGIPKLIKVISGDLTFSDPVGLGPEISLILSAFAEGICGLLLLFGAWTRLAAIPLIINMSVVSFIVHYGDPFGVKEKPLLYLLVFIVILIVGSGKYSIDHKLYTKRARN